MLNICLLNRPFPGRRRHIEFEANKLFCLGIYGILRDVWPWKVKLVWLINSINTNHYAKKKFIWWYTLKDKRFTFLNNPLTTSHMISITCTKLSKSFKMSSESEFRLIGLREAKEFSRLWRSQCGKKSLLRGADFSPRNSVKPITGPNRIK